MEEPYFWRRCLCSIICGLLCHLPAPSLGEVTTTFVQRGGRFTLSCHVEGPGVHLWYKDGRPVIPTAHNRFHLEADAPAYAGGALRTAMRLVVDTAHAQHAGEYRCGRAGHHTQRVVVVTENMIETNEEEPGAGKLLYPGEPLILQCSTPDCPQCTVLWSKDGLPLHRFPGRLELFEGNNSVRIESATYNDTGVYTCALDRRQFDVALNTSIVVQSKIKMEKFEQSSVVVEGSPLELLCSVKGAPAPSIKWFVGDQEVVEGEGGRVSLVEWGGVAGALLRIEAAEFSDRNHYTCEASNMLDHASTTVFVRVKDKLAALWPFLGILLEIAILCTIIFVYERRKRASLSEGAENDYAAITNKNSRDQNSKSQDIRQRK